MKQYIKIEFERVVKSKFVWISIFVGVLISVSQLIFEAYPFSKDLLSGYSGRSGEPKSLFSYWLGMFLASPYKETFLIIFPVLAMLPHALSYHYDIKSGYVKALYTRGRRKDYLVAKYIASFISAGIVVVLPYIINLLVASCMFPALKPIRNGQFISSASMFQDIYYSYPFAYIFIYIVITFLYGGVFSSIALALTGIVENVFILAMTPFLVWYGLNVVSKLVIAKSGQTISPIALIDMAQAFIVKKEIVFGVLIIVGIVSAVVYFVKGKITDVL